MIVIGTLPWNWLSKANIHCWSKVWNQNLRHEDLKNFLNSKWVKIHRKLFSQSFTTETIIKLARDSI